MLGGELTSTPTATASLSAATRTRECTATASAAAAARACVHVCIAIVTHMRREKVRAMERERGGERDRAVCDGDGSKGGIFLRGLGVRGEREREPWRNRKKKKREIFFVDGVIRAVAVAGKGSRPSDDHYGSSWPSNLTLVGLRCCKELMDIRDAMQLSLRHP